GYEPAVATLALDPSAATLPLGLVQSFQLIVDPVNCDAPGYHFVVPSDVAQGEPTCEAPPGGLVVGNVRDANTGGGLNASTVKNPPDGAESTSFATPDDPAQDDGFYALFGQSSSQPFEASHAGYASDTKTTIVVPGATQRLDFSIEAGVVDASPRPLSVRVDPGQTVD